ncbi:MAG: hypothetical protein IMW89_04390 [Ktedonobacteraceae bacterium]|nr:hypothetical protein [Ktedonobacteraceae bacterium]
MKTWLKIGLLAAVLAVAALVVTGATAFARGPVAQNTASAAGPGYGAGFRGGDNWGGPENSLVAIAAKELGMSQADLVAQLKSKTIAQVAKEKNVALDKIVNAFLAPRQEALKNAVAAGRLTQARADQMLATMKANVTAQLNKSWTPRGPGMGLGFVDANGDGICDNRTR